MNGCKKNQNSLQAVPYMVERSGVFRPFEGP